MKIMMLKTIQFHTKLKSFSWHDSYSETDNWITICNTASKEEYKFFISYLEAHKTK